MLGSASPRESDTETRPSRISFGHTAITGVAYQAVVSLYQLLIPAIIARGFDAHVLGLWLTAYSLFGLFQTINLGVPGVLLSAVDASAGASRAKNAALVRSALQILAVWCAVPLALAALVPVLPTPHGLALPAAAGPPSSFLVVLLAAAALTLPASLSQTLHIATHRSHKAYVTTTAVYVAWIPVIFVAAWLAVPFSILVLLFLGPPLVSGGLLWGAGLRQGYIAFARAGTPGAWRAMLSAGFAFQAMEITISIILRTPEAIISGARGLVEAGHFSVLQRFPLLLSAALAVVMQPLWPSLFAAARAADRPAAVALLRRVLGTTLLLWAGFAVFVMSFGRVLIQKWLGAPASPSYADLGLAVAFALAQSLHYAVSLMVVGLFAKKENLVVNVCMLAVYVPVCLRLTGAFGAQGTYVALIVSFGLVGVPLGALQIRKRLRAMQAPA